MIRLIILLHGGRGGVGIRAGCFSGSVVGKRFVLHKGFLYDGHWVISVHMLFGLCGIEVISIQKTRCRW